MVNICVDTKSKNFTSLVKEYNVSTATLENIIHQWYKLGYEDYNSTEFIQYLKDKLCLSTSSYDSSFDQKKAHKSWEKIQKTYATFPKSKMKEARIIATLLFGEDAFTIYETSKEGVYTLKIKEPVYKREALQGGKKEEATSERKTFSGMISSLKPNQIFVFGSNTQGRHGAGAAKIAKDKFGAKYGQAEGIQGQSYAIITKDLTKDDKKNPSRTPEQIKEQIHKLYEYAKQHPDKEFLVAYSSTGKNLNYYSNEAMAEIFASEKIPSNIVFEEGFNSLVFKETPKLEQSMTKEDLIVNPNFFHVESRNNPSIKKAIEEISNNLGHIVNIRPLTKEEIEEENGFGSDAVIEFSSGESMELSFSAGSMALTGKKAYNMFKALGREKDNPYRKGEKVVDTSKTASLFFAANVLAYDYFVDNPTKLQDLNIGENPLVTLNKELRGEQYDKSKDDIAKNSTTPFIIKKKEKTPNKLEESRTLVQQIIEDSKRRIKFDKATHTYTVDGKKADTSVTQYIHGNRDLGDWALPSGLLGTTVDEITRDYFSGKLKNNYPNLTKSQLANLISDLDKFRSQLDEKFGKGNYEVVTTEFPIASKYSVAEKNGKRTTKVMAGTMDMLIYDNKGNFYIYDMKTSRSGIKEDAKVGYSKQLSLYKEILESNYSQLKGKIKGLNLIEFSIGYPDPSDVSYYNYDQIEEGVEGQLYVTDEEGDIISIQESNDYVAPRFKTIVPVSKKRTTSLQALDILSDALVKEAIEESKEKPTTTPNLQQIGWDNNPLLTATEKRFLANQVMKLTSFIIGHLQQSRKASNHYFGNKYSTYDFTSMSRERIIETIGIGEIFNYVKEAFYNPENREDIEDFDTLDKLQVAYDHFSEVLRQGYSKLIALEGVSVVSGKPNFIKKEDIEESVENEFEQSSLEEKEREYWQVSIRQQSAKASLSTEIRRLFERLHVVDKKGKPVKDEYGFNMDTFVDSGEAINSILTWVSNATTIEEMEVILEEMTEANPWLNNILKAIKEEPIRSQFFQNFRKDFTTYSITRVEYDSQGHRKYVVDVINTKGADKTILNNTVNMFKMGLMSSLIKPIKGDLEGRGQVNEDNVKRLIKAVNIIKTNIEESFEDSTSQSQIASHINDLATILSQLGLPITPSILKSALASDSKRKNFKGSRTANILQKASYVLDTLISNKDNEAYNPMLKGEDGNVYGDYKEIIRILSPYIKDSVEASTYENGKMYYSFTVPSYMGKLINRLSNKLENLESFKEFLENEYGQYKWFKQGDVWNCPWLDKIAKSKELRQGLQHKVQLSFDRTEYTELSELSYTLSLMHEYFYDKKKSWAWYRLPILANKPSSEFIRFERLSGKNYKTQIKKGLRKVFNQELMRMKTVLERANNPNVEKIGAKGKIWFDIKSLDKKLAKKVKNNTLTLNDLVKEGKYIFSGSGAEFKFLSPLNLEIIQKTKLGQMIVDKLNGKKVDESSLDKLFYEAVDNFMASQMENEISNWMKIGLFETEESTKTVKGKSTKISRFKYASQFGENMEEILNNLEEYVWNDMYATINIIELTATDLAYYKNVEDFQKRYSQVHAPSMRLNTTARDENNILYSADGLERTIYLKDNIVEAEIIPNVEKIFKDKIKTLTGSQKTEMEIMMNLILTDLKEVNVADAQGYSSPTSYRKKMGMQGKWTIEMEEAYKQIREGNLNIDNLGVVWQPLKPFVYSQIKKTSGASTMSELKVPVQNKNSEYLLLIADAIMRSGKQANKLQAIFDFMEESAYDNGVYNGKGIDTVQFISAVNSGGMGAIDISSANTYRQTLKILNDHAYYNADKSASSDNDNDRYNEQYVHTISFEDYGIQQEVPAHMADHKQAMGSQVRILSVSDISEKASFNIKGETYDRNKLQKEYFELIAENIKDSFRQLEKDLGLSGSRLEKNLKMSALLQEAILKDQRYGSDLLRACSLDENGEFIIPLNDPIQSIRIQQLLNSIIKSRINKQKVQGGPAVQASAFGLSEDLHIRWKDKKGNLLLTRDEYKGRKSYEEYIEENQHSVAYFECYAPVPTEEMASALLKSDGSYMTPQEAIEKNIITEEMLKAIGYRIPTEDKYSIIPIKIKGFVPKAAGEVVIMPKEITSLTGSDFDIDKMYIMFKSFSVDKSPSDKKLIKSVFNDYLTGLGWTKARIRNYIEGNVNTGESSLLEYIRKIEDGVGFVTEVNGEYVEDEKGLQIYDWYIANKHKINASLKFEENLNLNTREGRDNKIFDLQWAVLTNTDTMEKMFNPGSFNVQKKAARIVSILKSSSKYSYADLSKKKLEELDEIIESSSNLNIIFPSTQVYFHKQNMTAGKLIGIFANNNTSHAFLSMQDIQFNISEKDAFMFNGILIDNEHNNKVDNLRDRNGGLISKTIAGFLAASVDAVKDPVLNYLNLNTMTAGSAMVLARLGFDTDSIGLFLTQPIIEKASRIYFQKNNESYYPIENVIDDILEESDIEYNLLDKNLKDTEFTKEELAKALKTGKDNTEFQIRTLLLFKRLSKMGKDLGTLTFLTKFNSVTNAVGPTIADTLVMKERYNKFLDVMNSKTPPFNQSAKDVIHNNAMLKAFYDTTVGNRGASVRIFGDYFPHYSDAFTSILFRLRGTTKDNIDSKTINKLVMDFILYKLTIGDNPVVDGSYNNRNRYINNFVEEFSEKTKDILDNDFIKIISVNPKNAKCPVAVLESKTGGYSVDVQESVKDGWSDLLRNPETVDLGIDLFFYNLIRSGFNFSPKTSGHLASVDVRRSIPGYINAISDPMFMDEDVIIDEFLTQFRRNHTQDNKIVPTLKSHSKVKVSYTKNVNKENVITFKFDAKKKLGIKSILIDDSGESNVWAPVINYEDKVYMNPVEVSDGVLRYIETTPLGNPNNFLEYNYNEGTTMVSVIGKQSSESREDEKDNSSIHNPTQKYEGSSRGRSINAKEIDRAIQEVLGSPDTQIVGLKVEKGERTKNDFINFVVKEAASTVGDQWTGVIERKVKEIVKGFCK